MCTYIHRELYKPKKVLFLSLDKTDKGVTSMYSRFVHTRISDSVGQFSSLVDLDSIHRNVLWWKNTGLHTTNSYIIDFSSDRLKFMVDIVNCHVSQPFDKWEKLGVTRIGILLLVFLYSEKHRNLIYWVSFINVTRTLYRVSHENPQQSGTVFSRTTNNLLGFLIIISTISHD